VLVLIVFLCLSESGKLFTWGSTDDMGQSYVAAGKHEVLITGTQCSSPPVFLFFST